jgi:hypothetical protein
MEGDHSTYLGARRPLVRLLLIAMSCCRDARAVVKHCRLFRLLMQYVLADDICPDASSQWRK